MNNLPRKARNKIDKFVRNFQSNPTSPGLNYETIKNASDPNFRSIRVDQNYRAIVHKPKQGGVYLLCWIDSHDKAYTWAVRRRCQVHPRTGSLQIYVTEEILVHRAYSTNNQRHKGRRKGYTVITRF